MFKSMDFYTPTCFGKSVPSSGRSYTKFTTCWYGLITDYLSNNH